VVAEAPDMEALDWSNATIISATNHYFEKYVIAYNLCDIHLLNVVISITVNDGPCPFNAQQKFSCNPKEDYEHLVNYVQRNMKCIIDSCLRKNGKKGKKMEKCV